MKVISTKDSAGEKVVRCSWFLNQDLADVLKELHVPAAPEQFVADLSAKVRQAHVPPQRAQGKA